MIKDNNKCISEQKKIIIKYKTGKEYQKEFDSLKNNLEKQMNKTISNYIKILHDDYIKLVKKANLDKIESNKKILFDCEEKRKKEFQIQNDENEKNKTELLTICKSNNKKHFNKKCEICEENPIKGILYECSECKEFYLCEKCEEWNFIYKKHKHNFIKIRKLNLKLNIINENDEKKHLNNKNKGLEIKYNNKNIENEEKKEDDKNNKYIEIKDEKILKEPIKPKNLNDKVNDDSNNFHNSKLILKEEKPNLLKYKTDLYSFSIEPIEFDFNSLQKVNRISFDICNNGNLKWIENKAYLKLQDNDYFISDKIHLPSLNKNEKKRINLNLKQKVKKLTKQKYKLKFELIIENQIYENPIEICINYK